MGFSIERLRNFEPKLVVMHGPAFVDSVFHRVSFYFFDRLFDRSSMHVDLVYCNGKGLVAKDKEAP